MRHGDGGPRETRAPEHRVASAHRARDHPVGDWGAATREARRVWGPGGPLILADLLSATFGGPVGRLFPPARTYQLEDLLEELSAAGFEATVVRPIVGLGYRLAARASRT